ncbi:hypothetical protein YP76_08765 [Sphingobium chungbukense]|uniref:Uncharacterized protein n=1 Tax=Sphingobium chungbukense TaxID=56193 RepID=A0A0M3ARW9_9SPHN|nr:hypothetical protein YP76_08765 [Sphingobium chungbukense]
MRISRHQFLSFKRQLMLLFCLIWTSVMLRRPIKLQIPQTRLWRNKEYLGRRQRMTLIMLI